MKTPGKPVVAMLAAFVITLPAGAAVSLEITKPPVIGPPTGPVQDPLAARGQWFADGTVRTHEFHDNVAGSGGGVAGSAAIQGIVSSITFAAGPGSAILAFQVSASITNDTASWVGPWTPGTNAHGETQTAAIPYVGAMVGTMLTVEFALADLANQPAQWNLPYTQVLPEIIANNEKTTAWYCYDGLFNPASAGAYYVPAWDFGTIAPGQTVTQTLDFLINGPAGMAGTDPRYLPLVQSFGDQTSDILMNRTTSLKISNWVDGIWVDNGSPYPQMEEVALNSNASVFHIPEPSGLLLLGLAGCLALRRRG